MSRSRRLAFHTVGEGGRALRLAWTPYSRDSASLADHPKLVKKAAVLLTPTSSVQAGAASQCHTGSGVSVPHHAPATPAPSREVFSDRVRLVPSAQLQGCTARETLIILSPSASTARRSTLLLTRPCHADQLIPSFTSPRDGNARPVAVELSSKKTELPPLSMPSNRHAGVGGTLGAAFENFVGEGVCEELGVPVCVDEGVPVCVELGVPVCVELGVPVCVEEGVPVWVELGVPVCVEDGVPVCEALGVPVCVELGVLVCVAVCDEVCVGAAVIDGVVVAVGVDVELAVFDAVVDGV